MYPDDDCADLSVLVEPFDLRLVQGEPSQPAVPAVQAGSREPTCQIRGVDDREVSVSLQVQRPWLLRDFASQRAPRTRKSLWLCWYEVSVSGGQLWFQCENI
eukprot:1093964_1